MTDFTLLPSEYFKRVIRFLFKSFVLVFLLLFLFSPYSQAESLKVALQVMPASDQAAQQDTTVHGTVTSAKDGNPLPGVTVKVKGTNTGTSTNKTGGFRLKVPQGGSVLTFSLVGYQDNEVKIAGRSQINVSLNEEVKELDELVVVGYGSQYRKDLTGSVSSVSKSTIDKQTVSSPEQLLQGQVSGVQVTKNSGAPGGGSTVRIRGVNSIRAGNNPLYVVDGLPIGGGSTPDQNPLSLINPQDIVSIEVLKDASATAIYGSRGANGVVLITTNQGGGNTLVDVEAKYGVNSVRKEIELLNTEQYISLANEAAASSGEDPVFANASSNPDTDWQDEVFRSAPQQSYQLSVTGGNEDTRYSLSGNFTNEKGILIGSDYKKGSFRINFDKDVSDKFKVGNNLIVSRAQYGLIETGGRGLSGIVNGALQIPSVVPVRDADGNYVFQGDNRNAVERDNPVASALEKTDTSDRFRGVGNFFGEYMITPELQARVSIGGNLGYRKQDFYAPRSTLQGRQNDGVASVATCKSFRWTNENTLTYENEFAGLHKLTLLGGFTLERETNENLNGASSGFVTDAYKFNNLGAGETPNNPATGATESSLVSYLGRANYNFDDRYLVTLTGRIDGSSRFGEGNKYGFFPSGALAWRISNESFMKNQKLISNMKLRLSYGVTGNQEIDDYVALPQLGFSQVTFGNRVAIGINPATLGNEELKWERTAQYDLGLDVGLFNGRINFTGDVYYKKTTDLLLTQRVPRYTGFSQFLSNIGSTENKGLELALETQNIAGEEFSWNSSLNFSTNRNKVLKLADDDPLFVGTPIEFASGQSFRIIDEGKSLGSFYGFEYGGVYADQAAVDNSPTAVESSQPGDPYLVDSGGPDGAPDGQIDGNDRKIIGNAFPDFTFGFTNNFFYKGFDLSIFIQGSYGNDVLNMNILRLETVRGFTNQTTDVLNRWTPENTNTDIPRAARSRNSPSQTAMRAISSRLIEDGSYLRLKNLTLGYTLPVDWVGSFGARSLRIYASALNLVTLTKYDGYDPEVSTYNNLGNLGADYGTYPKAKTYLMGIKLGF